VDRDLGVRCPDDLAAGFLVLTAVTVLDEASASARYLVLSDGSSLGHPYGLGVLLQARVVAT
jgi:hypothetical protein